MKYYMKNSVSFDDCWRKSIAVDENASQLFQLHAKNENRRAILIIIIIYLFVCLFTYRITKLKRQLQ